MNTFFNELERQFNFKILKEPNQLSGGFTHKMYYLSTTKGQYAIKLLNPFIMQRETAFANYNLAERLEKLLEEKRISILPSLSFNDKKMQEINGQFFYLYDFFEGCSLSGKEITEWHCRKMGEVLASIHNIETSKSDEIPAVMKIDWEFYIARMQKENDELYRLLKNNYSIIIDSQEKGNFARKNLSPIRTICHNDMDCKNVLWRINEYRIIDLECLSYNSPIMELFELALCWSGYEECNINFSLFRSFIMGYTEAGGVLPDDWETLYYCNNGRLEWLEYNIKRVLGIDCGADEKEIGIGQVVETIRHIVYYNEVREQILSNCNRIGQ